MGASMGAAGKSVLDMTDVEYRVVLEHRLTAIETKVGIIGYGVLAAVGVFTAVLSWLLMHVP